MFNSLTIDQLESLLDNFSVPMFVIESDGTAGALPIAGLNRAMEDLVGVSRDEILGRSVLELTAQSAVPDTIESYQRCVATGQTIRFAFQYSDERQETSWEKTLQYSRSPDGAHRIISTAIKAQRERPALLDQLAFEDVRYFSSIADLQLENLNRAFSTATQEARVSPIDEDRIMRLHAVCRSVQRTVSDIKQSVQAAQARHETTQRNKHRSVSNSIPLRNIRQGMGTVRALSEACEDAISDARPKALRNFPHA